jgi:D-sedoheptulose 7-phosphate isomerase
MTSNPVDALDYVKSVDDLISSISNDSWNELHKIMMNAWEFGVRVLVIGNGGNFGNALHFETDWTKGLYFAVGRSINIVTIGSNYLMQSAFENDLGHEDALASQIRMFAQESDILLCLSAGGTSENIHQAAVVAKELNLKLIGIFGRGAKEKNLSIFDEVLLIESEDVMLIEDVTAIFGHSVKAYIEKIAKKGRKS